LDGTEPKIPGATKKEKNPIISLDGLQVSRTNSYDRNKKRKKRVIRLCPIGTDGSGIYRTLLWFWEVPRSLRSLRIPPFCLPPWGALIAPSCVAW